MVKYARQKDKFRCGPYAILNALKWSGHKYSERQHIDYLSKLVRCKNKVGTLACDMLYGISKIQKEFKSTEYIHIYSSKKINRHLKKGGAVIVNIAVYHKKNKRWGGHYIFISKIHKHRYKVINYYKNKTIGLIKHRNLQNDIQNCRLKRHFSGSSCWLLERR